MNPLVIMLDHHFWPPINQRMLIWQTPKKKKNLLKLKLRGFVFLCIECALMHIWVHVHTLKIHGIELGMVSLFTCPSKNWRDQWVSLTMRMVELTLSMNLYWENLFSCEADNIALCRSLVSIQMFIYAIFFVFALCSISIHVDRDHWMPFAV